MQGSIKWPKNQRYRVSIVISVTIFGMNTQIAIQVLDIVYTYLNNKGHREYKKSRKNTDHPVKTPILPKMSCTQRYREMCYFLPLLKVKYG